MVASPVALAMGSLHCKYTRPRCSRIGTMPVMGWGQSSPRRFGEPFGRAGRRHIAKVSRTAVVADLEAVVRVAPAVLAAVEKVAVEGTVVEERVKTEVAETAAVERERAASVVVDAALLVEAVREKAGQGVVAGA